MKIWSIVAIFALLGFVAYGHPHPRRIERSVVGAQNPDLQQIGILDAGIIHAHEAHIGNLSSGRSQTSFLDGGIVQFGYMNSSSGDLVYDNSLTYIHTLCLDGVVDCESYFNQTGTETEIYLRDGRPFRIDGNAQVSEREYWFYYGLDGGYGGAWQWSGQHVQNGGVEWLSGTGALFQQGSALEVRGLMSAADAGFGGNISVAGTSALNVVDAGVVYFGNLSSPGRNRVFGQWGFSDGSGPAPEDRNMGPGFKTGDYPPKFGVFTVTWNGAGSGGTNGVQVSVYEYPSGPTLCSCFVGPCSTAAHSNLECACNTEALANKTYVGRVGAGTDCAANPSDLSIGLQILR